MKNMKTSVFGLLSAIAAFILSDPGDFNPLLVKVAAFILAGGLAGLGLTAKDYTTHSTEAEVQHSGTNDKPTP